jgi:beta-xylosidase
MLATGGLYAPTIRYHEGTFYVVCTNVLHFGPVKEETHNFIVSTKDIWEGEWSDPVFFEFGGIDPSILFDTVTLEDGSTTTKAYLHGSAGPGPKTTIQAFEIDLATGAKLSPQRLLWEGTGGIYPEGPHIYKRPDGWYHLVISEGGTHEGHMITAARSREVFGPYEPCPHNPLLTAKGTDEYVRYTGHLDTFQDDEGKWWAVCLGVRKEKSGGRFIMGRETFLTRGDWSGEWLQLERVKISPAWAEGMKSTTLSVRQEKKGEIDLLYIRDADFGRYKVEQGGQQITLTSSSTDLSAGEESPSFVGKFQRTLNGQSSVSITPDTSGQSWETAGLKAGLAVYKDELRYIRVFLDAAANSAVFELVNGGQKTSKSEKMALDGDIAGMDFKFRLEYTELEYRALFKAGSGEWVKIGTVDTLELTDPDFVGPVIGVFAVNVNSEAEACAVVFDSFTVE